MPIYQDANVTLHAGFMRITGEIELLMLLNSFYEYCDLRMYMLQIFGGTDRWIHPNFFNSFFYFYIKQGGTIGFYGTLLKNIFITSDQTGKLLVTVCSWIKTRVELVKCISHNSQ